MLKFGRAVVKYRVPILILAILLVYPSVLGMTGTRINYDMLYYLPDDMETVQGQNILMDDFGKGAFSFVIVEGMADKDVAVLREKIEQVPHVDSVIWYDSLVDLSVPMEALPDKVTEAFNSGDATLMAVFFDSSTSSDATIGAVQQIRALAGEQCFVSGMSALVTDLKRISEREEPIYVTIAVVCAFAAMMLLSDSWLVPLVWLAGIGFAILYNMGTNYFLGEISYITKALAAVLQLAVTMDYSIFLWHAYCEQRGAGKDSHEAMAEAVAATLPAVTGSSLTTVAGFLALCFMSYTMGMDLGIVMAKGVVFGLLSSITILPALILLFDRPLQITRHRALIPNMRGVSRFVTKRYPLFLALFAVILVPAAIGYGQTPVYYDFTNILTTSDVANISSEDMGFLIANTKLKDEFNIATTHMILCRSDLPAQEGVDMLGEIKAVDGVTNALGINSVLGPAVPEEMVPQKLLDTLRSGGKQLILINSSYDVSTDECNAQIDAINAILKKYDPDGMLIGEGPCTKDLIKVTDRDFTVVTWISIAAVFLIVALTLKSASLPVLLVAVIEFAIFINLGIPYYTNFSMPFIAPICISTIQLGSTVDYAILLTTRYRKERHDGLAKQPAIETALTASIPSILVSSIGFFAATFGVSVYTDISLVSSMCNLFSRGAIVSMLSVILILPAFLMLLDKVICKTSAGFRNPALPDQH